MGSMASKAMPVYVSSGVYFLGSAEEHKDGLNIFVPIEKLHLGALTSTWGRILVGIFGQCICNWLFHAAATSVFIFEAAALGLSGWY